MIAGVIVLIGLPLVAAAVTFVVRRWRTLTALLAAGAAGALGVAALLIPLGRIVTVAGRQIAVSDPVNILGRQMVITEADRLTLAAIYLVAAGLFLVGWRTRPGTTFFSLGLAILGLISAAFVAQPFLYAALFLTLAAILAAILAQGGTPGRTRGTARYLVTMTLALPAFLIAGWLVELYIPNPTDTELARGVVLSLAGGFALLLGSVPFNIWIGPLAEEAQPVESAFVFTIVNGAGWLFLFDLLQTYPWLAAQPDVFRGMEFLGLLTAIAGGLLAFSSFDFAHVMGYGVLADYGCSLVVLSTRTPAGLETVLVAALARPVSLSLLALGIALARERARSSNFEKLTGLAWSSPWTAVALVAGGFSIAGIPPLVGYVGRWSATRLMATAQPNVEWPVYALLLLGATVGVAAGTLRGMDYVFARPVVLDLEEDTLAQARPAREPRLAILFIVLGLVAVLILGLFPGVVDSALRVIVSSYTFFSGI